MQIDWNVIVEYLPNLVAGARVTLAMTGLALRFISGQPSS